MHNNYLSVWSVLYCDMSQAFYTDISRQLHTVTNNIPAYIVTYFKYNKQQQLTVFPYSIL